ncbi:MAG: Ig-like domain-containing protein [Planctomycetota bacterium]
MRPPLKNTPTTVSGSAWGLASLGLGLALGFSAVSCSGGGTGGAQGGASNPEGTYASTPDGESYFFTDANEQGRSNALRLENMYWGRLVDVFGLDSSGERVLRHTDMVIGKSVQSDGTNYLLRSNPVTAIQELTILRDVTDDNAGGGWSSSTAPARHQNSLDPITQQGPTGGTAGLFSMVPRNAAVVLKFNDLIDPTTVDDQTVRVLTGLDFTSVYEPRILADQNFGDLADFDGLPGQEFYSTRVIIDPTVSVLESYQFNPAHPVNSQGYPPSTQVNLPNLLVRIPTQESLSQQRVLRNLTDHPLNVNLNGAWDSSVGTQDIVRAVRTGGTTSVTGDSYNGYLLDNEAPTIVGSSAVEIVGAPQQQPGTSTGFLLPIVRFESQFCAKLPEEGDVVAQLDQGIFAEVISAGNLVGTEAYNVLVRLRQYPSEWDELGLGPGNWTQTGAGLAELQSSYRPLQDAGRLPCFVRINPLPAGYPANPNTGVEPGSTFQVRFSEPMDPVSVTAFDSMVLTRAPMNPDNDPSLPTSDFIVGSVGQAPDFQSFTFQPADDLNHSNGTAEEYYINLLAGNLGLKDLAGNPIAEPILGLNFFLRNSAQDVSTGGRVSRFSALDEEPENPLGPSTIDVGGEETEVTAREWDGQHLYDLLRQTIRPRPVSRFTIAADRQQTVPGLMIPFSAGIQTPLSNLGSKAQILYRFCDMGWTLEDKTQANIDVYGLAWAPVNGLVTFDSFSEFEMRMSHTRYAPDEIIDPGTAWPLWPQSGLQAVYTSNLLDGVADPQKVVSPRADGYIVDPGNVFSVAGTTTQFMPFPMNQNLDPGEEDLTYTWRDTSLLHRAGPRTAVARPTSRWRPSAWIPVRTSTARPRSARSVCPCWSSSAAIPMMQPRASTASTSTWRPTRPRVPTSGPSRPADTTRVRTCTRSTRIRAPRPPVASTPVPTVRPPTVATTRSTWALWTSCTA